MWSTSACGQAKLVPESQAPLPCVALVPAGSMQRGWWLPVYTAGADTQVPQAGCAEFCSILKENPNLFPQMKLPLQCLRDQGGICATLIVQAGWSLGQLSHTGRGILHNSPQALQALSEHLPVSCATTLVLPPPAQAGAAERTAAVCSSLKKWRQKD